MGMGGTCLLKWPGALPILVQRVRAVAFLSHLLLVPVWIDPQLSLTDTKHVPCKFFRQGACQAGLACPFLHTTDAAADSAPCKYFQKVWVSVRADLTGGLLS